jgi:hypothetical protein
MVSMSVSSWIYIQHTDLGFTEQYEEDNGKGNLPLFTHNQEIQWTSQQKA